MHEKMLNDINLFKFEMQIKTTLGGQGEVEGGI